MHRDDLERRLRAALLSALVLALPLAARAQDAAATPAPAPAPAHTLTGNVGIFSQYAFRGVAQTAGGPALQGGFDYAHASGVYAGTWLSNISWLQDFAAYSRSSVELDVYGGIKKTIGDSGVFVDVGTLYYVYPGKRYPGIPSADAWELYGGVGWNWVSAKYSYNVKDYFGARPVGEKTDGTWYLDLSATVPAGESGVSIVAHAGVLNVANDGADDLEVSATDWKLGATWLVPKGLLKGFELGAYYSGNSSDSAFYRDLTGFDTARDTGVVYVKRSF